MRKIRQVERPYRVIRFRPGKAAWTYDCKWSKASAEAVAASLRIKHPKETIEVRQ